MTSSSPAGLRLNTYPSYHHHHHHHPPPSDLPDFVSFFTFLANHPGETPRRCFILLFDLFHGARVIECPRRSKPFRFRARLPFLAGVPMTLFLYPRPWVLTLFLVSRPLCFTAFHSSIDADPLLTSISENGLIPVVPHPLIFLSLYLSIAPPFFVTPS
jgi:hypothetical protein